MTTIDPPALDEALDEISEWDAPERPPEPRRDRDTAPAGHDRRLRPSALIAVAISVLCTLLLVVWVLQTRSNQAATASSRAATAGAATSSAELQVQLDQLTDDVGEMLEQKDQQKVQFLQSVDERDRLRDQLERTEAQLVDTQARINGSYATVLNQGNTMALLDDCLRGVGRVLNLAAVEADDAAAAELFAHYGSCIEANKAIGAAP